MTSEEALAELDGLRGGHDIEVLHSRADEVLIELVRAWVPNGDAIADAWDAIEKWYA